MTNSVEILLVEDNASDSEMTIHALKTSNLANNLLHVKDGAAALDYIFAEGEYEGREVMDKPRVILLDLKMPRISGIEVLKRIRSDERTKAIPVVVLTSSKEDPDIQKCYDLGVNSYVVKPVEFEDFQKAISELGLYWMIVNQLPNM
jgi:two-component system response regulator